MTLKLYYDQVNNRDISIAVLRTFISKRKQEYETMLSRRTKAVQKVSSENASNLEAPTESNTHNEKSNGECEELEEIAQEEPCSISEEPVKIPEGKGRQELKPPRVLEVCEKNLGFISQSSLYYEFFYILSLPYLAV